MSHANVSRCLKTLKELDLVRLVHTDFKRGNVWWISPLACPSGGGTGGRSLPKKEVPQVEAAQDYRGATSKSERTSHKTRAEVPRSEGENKKLRKENIIKEARRPLSAFPVPTLDGGPSEYDYEHAILDFEAEEGEERRKDLVKDFVDRELSHGFLPPTRVLQRLVAYDWLRRRAHEKANVENGETVPKARACA